MAELSELQKKTLKIINRNFLMSVNPDFSDSIQGNSKPNLQQFHGLKDIFIDYLDSNDLINDDKQKDGFKDEIGKAIDQNSQSLEKLSNSSIFCVLLDIGKMVLPAVLSKYGKEDV